MTSMRLVAIVLCLTLTGCLTTDEPAPAVNPSAPPASTSAPDKPAPAQRRPQPAAVRGANAPPVPPPQTEEAQVDPVMEIRQMCWSQGNANKAFRTVEARADWVNACVAEKLKALR